MADTAPARDHPTEPPGDPLSAADEIAGVTRDGTPDGEAIYRALFHAVPDAVLVYTLSDDGPDPFIEANDVAVERYGYTREELLRMRPTDLFEAGSRDYLHAIDRLQRQGSIVADVRHLAKGGRPIRTEVAAHLIALGGRRTVLAVCRDVSEREDSEVAFRLLADATPQLVWTATSEGRVDYYNRRATAYDGLHRQHDGVWAWDAVVHPDDDGRTAAAWRRALESGAPYEVEHRIRMADGAYRWHLSRGEPVRGTDGRVMRWYGTATDVHDLKEAEAALRESRTMLQLVLDHIPQGVFWKDRDGRFLGTNAVAARATGFEWPEDVVGLTDYDLLGVTPEQAAFFQRKDREVMASGEPLLGIEEPLGHPDGSTSWLHTNKVPLRDGSGRVIGVLGTWEDVTERRRAQEALRQLNDTLEERVAERTREVREQERRVRELSRALTLAEQRERQRIAHVLHDDLQQVLFGAKMAAALSHKDRLQAVLDQALDLTRTLSHELSPPLLQGEDLEDLLRWLVEQAKERHGLEVEVEVSGGVPVPDAEVRVLLYQVVRELLFNVAKHAGTTQASIRAERVDGHIRVVVEDEGAGFPSAKSGEAPTRGLGLPSARERLELVGGRMEIESEPVHGTRVTIVVPVEDTAPEEA